MVVRGSGFHARHSTVGGGAVTSVVLMHFDGTNGSTTFTDVYGHPFSAYTGSPTLSTTQAKFGPSSLSVGSASAGISTSSASDLTIGAGDFTWECWFYPTNPGAGTQRVISQQTDGVTFALLRISSGTKIEAVFSNLSNTTLFSLVGTTTITANTWHHGAVCRSGSNAYVFLDGNLEASTASASGTIGGAPPLAIGGYQAGAGPTELFNGFIDELRISKIARYTASFTPSGPFTS
jgi:Concanavalin A-like lectin/glucanases superfamily